MKQLLKPIEVGLHFREYRLGYIKTNYNAKKLQAKVNKNTEEDEFLRCI